MKNLLLILLIWNSSVHSQTDFFEKLSGHAITLTYDKVIYDGRYQLLAYPNGDVAKDRGVCTDVIIRAYRKMCIDLQKEVHQDMKRNFSAYPKTWGLKRPDPNIDHRRVLNLMTYFCRKNAKVPSHKTQRITYPGTLSVGNSTTD